MGLLSKSLLDDGRSLLPLPQLCQQTHHLNGNNFSMALAISSGLSTCWALTVIWGGSWEDRPGLLSESLLDDGCSHLPFP